MRMWAYFVLLCIVSIGSGCKDADAKNAAKFVESRDLSVKVVEASANDGAFDVPVGRHLAQVDYNSRLRVTPVVSADRAELIADLSKLIGVVNSVNNAIGSASSSATTTMNQVLEANSAALKAASQAESLK